MNGIQKVTVAGIHGRPSVTVTVLAGYSVVKSGKIKRGDRILNLSTKRFREAGVQKADIGDFVAHHWCIIRKGR